MDGNNSRLSLQRRASVYVMDDLQVWNMAGGYELQIQSNLKVANHKSAERDCKVCVRADESWKDARQTEVYIKIVGPHSKIQNGSYPPFPRWSWM